MAGLPVTDDYNGSSAVGFGRSQYSIRDGKRCSAAVGYLHPAMKRKNLTVEDAGACGPRRHAGQPRHRRRVRQGRQRCERPTPTREVILCGGAFNSPQLLMLSGIGPADHLRSVGIEPVVDLPVGKNLQDHLAVLMMYRAHRGAASSATTCGSTRWRSTCCAAYMFGTGPATVVPGGLHAFIKTRPELAVPDIEFMFRGAPPAAALWFPGWKKPYADGYGIRPCLLHPDSRGEVLLRSSDPRDKVKIVTNFLSAPNDLPTLRQGFKIAREVAAQPPLARFRGAETVARPERQDRRRDRQLDQERRGDRQPSGLDLHDGHRAEGGGRSAVPRARRRAAARGRRLGDAGPCLRAHQRLRADDGGEGLRHDPRQARAGARRHDAPSRSASSPSPPSPTACCTATTTSSSASTRRTARG